MDKIGFYSREEEYGWLSNFHRKEMKINGKHYQTIEHYYQSNRTNDPVISTWIRLSPTPYLAMKAGRSLREHETIPNWGNKKVEIMLNGLRHKFQDPELRQKLLDTNTAELFEDSPTDMFWGGRLEGSKNMLGILLMQIREEIRHMSKEEEND